MPVARATRPIRPVLLLFALVGGLVAASPRPVVAQTLEQGPSERAVALSVLEASGDFNALYDLIHPDAHAVIPRAAVIGWFQDTFAPRGPGVSTVTDVEFVAWTWPVTGQTYPVSAEVSYEQPFADGPVEAGVVRLVRDETGEWRWFFGRDRAFVEAQIARYAPRQAAVVGAAAGVVAEVRLDVDTFWARAFGGGDVPYAAPGFVGVDGPVATACGTGESLAFYCPLDQTIYYAPAFFADQEQGIGDFAWVVIVAHEWGHHVQTLLGIEPTPGPGFELQADCAAGAYTRDAATRGLLNDGDITEAVTSSASAGDPPWLPRDQLGAHGTNDDRITAFMAGYLGGFLGCEITLLAADTTGAVSTGDPAPVADAGLFRLLPSVDEIPPGVEVTEEIQRSLPEVAANYVDPAETTRRFEAWGWRGNAARRFGPAANVRLAATATSALYVSLHRFGDAASASAALDYSVEDQLRSRAGAREVTVGATGDRARALAADDPDGVEVTVYAQRGDLLVRVTAERPVGDPIADALSVARGIVAAAG